MDKLKQQIQQKLTANIIADKCTQSEYLIFRDAWCTQERVLRFTTPFFREFFSIKPGETGKWKTGDCVMYEVHNRTDSLTVNCVLILRSVPADSAGQAEKLLELLGLKPDSSADEIILKSSILTGKSGDLNSLFEAFAYLIEKEIPRFEYGIREKLDSAAPKPEVLLEGAAERTLLNKYERNPQARAACIAARGTACTVCGIDFGKEYGPEFEGKIEVHHIVPLSEIGEEYAVDPVNDLVPVCPNCHTALHSKKDGVYTVDELIKIRNHQ